MANKNENTKNPDHPGWPRRIVGMLLLPVVVFAFMALLSYDCWDIEELKSPPTSNNLFGIVGAWCVFWGYRLFGFAVWLVPFWILALAMALAAGRGKHLCRRIAGFVLLLLIAATVCALLPWGA